MIAESSKEFDCSTWKDLIFNEAKNQNINEYVCKDEDVNGKKVHRLYAQEKIDDGSNKNHKKLIIIIVVVAVVVVVIVIVVIFLVYFLVYKKRPKNSSEKEDDADGEYKKEQDEV